MVKDNSQLIENDLNTREVAQNIFKALAKHNLLIKDLNFSNNDIGDETSNVFAESLGKLKHLDNLNLSI